MTNLRELRDQGAPKTLPEDAWKQRVVDVAMIYAKRHNWCDVVRSALKEAGLEGYLPKVIIVQRRDRRYDNWFDWKEARSLDSGMTIVKEHKKQHYRIRLQDLMRNAKVPDSEEEAATIATKVYKAASAPQFPIYRVIRKPQGTNNNSPDLEVLYSEEDPPAKKVAAKKTAAKKVAAKKAVAKKAVAPQALAT